MANFKPRTVRVPPTVMRALSHIYFHRTFDRLEAEMSPWAYSKLNAREYALTPIGVLHRLFNVTLDDGL